jgi:hypothetical protein
MITTTVVDVPATLASAACPRAQLTGTGLPWATLPALEGAVTGAAMPTGTDVRGEQPEFVLTTAAQRNRTAGVAVAGLRSTRPAAVRGIAPTASATQDSGVQTFAPTHPYSTLGNHSPGRPQS